MPQVTIQGIYTNAASKYNGSWTVVYSKDFGTLGAAADAATQAAGLGGTADHLRGRSILRCACS